VDGKLQGRSKAEIQEQMQGMVGCGHFFAQHGMLLLSGGGLLTKAQKMGSLLANIYCDTANHFKPI